MRINILPQTTYTNDILIDGSLVFIFYLFNVQLSIHRSKEFVVKL